MKKKAVPTFDELMNPTLQALKRLGGSASIDELVPEIVRRLELPQELADVPHGTTSRTELEYRSAWGRTYLRKAGLIENSERGIWALTPLGSQTESVDGRRIAREVAKQFQTEQTDGGESGEPPVRIGGLISFNVLFQSKRYKGNIGPDIVRDFRGAMVGRADKGVIISTGGFTLEARREAHAMVRPLSISSTADCSRRS